MQISFKDQSIHSNMKFDYLCILCRAIDHLPKILNTFVRSMTEQTGCLFTILAGGPNPHHSGKVTMYRLVKYSCHKILADSCHSAYSRLMPDTKKEFDTFVDKNNWKNIFVFKWDSFLHQVFHESISGTEPLMWDSCILAEDICSQFN